MSSGRSFNLIGRREGIGDSGSIHRIEAPPITDIIDIRIMGLVAFLFSTVMWNGLWQRELQSITSLNRTV